MVLPAHVAIIMDGNGRWAAANGMSRGDGHSAGLDAARRVVKHASDLGIGYVTLYVFSTENWKRTQDEVGFLMGLIKKHLRAELSFYQENKLRVVHIGDIDGLPVDIAHEIRVVEKATAAFQGLTVILAINYGSKSEILRAVNRIVASSSQLVSEDQFAAALDTEAVPPVDLLIRTGGEQRLSNFLLWQAAYAELYFCDTLWPDWQEDNLDRALTEYQKRTRRFGGRP